MHAFRHLSMVQPPPVAAPVPEPSCLQPTLVAAPVPETPPVQPPHVAAPVPEPVVQQPERQRAQSAPPMGGYDAGSVGATIGGYNAGSAGATQGDYNAGSSGGSWSTGRGCAGSKGKGKGKSKGKNDFNISKALSKILRHDAVNLGLHVRSDGFCGVDEVLALQQLRNYDCTFETMQAIVNNNDKARFEIRIEPAGQALIRAAQGHSMTIVNDEDALQQLSVTDNSLPEVCCHGTYKRYLAGIQAKGLLPGGGWSSRKHVHFTPYAPGDGRVISGMRYNCEVAIFIDLRRALQDGVPFFRSTNNVILSPGMNGTIPPTYIQEFRHL